MQAPRNSALSLVRTRLSWPPSAQSPFARSACYLRRGGLKAAWRGVTPSSSLIRAHAPDHDAPRRLRFARCARGLFRLSPVPAGRWPFPTLSLRPLCRCSDPYPAALLGCTCPFLHRGHRPHPTGNGFGARIYPHMAPSVGSRISWLQSFDHLRAPALARPPDCSDRDVCTPGPQAFHTTHRPAGYPNRMWRVASRPTWTTDVAGLSPAGSQPCRLLPPAHGSPTSFTGWHAQAIESLCR